MKYPFYQLTKYISQILAGTFLYAKESHILYAIILLLVAIVLLPILAIIYTLVIIFDTVSLIFIDPFNNRNILNEYRTHVFYKVYNTLEKCQSKKYEGTLTFEKARTLSYNLSGQLKNNEPKDDVISYLDFEEGDIKDLAKKECHGKINRMIKALKKRHISDSRKMYR